MVDYQIDSGGAKIGIFLRAMLVLLTLLLSGCGHWQAIAERDQLQHRLVSGAGFQHRLLWNAAAQRALEARRTSTQIWHVYLEGDGHAVNAFGQPSADPTPPAPILLPALAVDSAPALYLGRPCYFDTADDHCHPGRWTLERYSAGTVSSLRAAASGFIPAQDRIILIGHSGGGALALLLAAQLPQTCAVITLAGNLDVGAWIKANDFTPLPDSIDPATRPPLLPAIAQWHFAGAEDKVILPQWIQAVSAHQPDAHYVLLPDTDHIRPWQHHLINSLKDQRNTASAPDPGAPLRPALDNSHTVCGKVTE